MSDRTLAVIAGILILVIVGGLIFRSLPDSTSSKSGGETDKEVTIAPKNISRVIAKVRDCSQVGHKTHLTGHIVNTGNTTLSMVTVQSLWKNSAGLILAQGLIYVVSRESPLEPGESRDFEDVTETSNVRKCNVEPLEWGI
jgi:hypothetical protein